MNIYWVLDTVLETYAEHLTLRRSSKMAAIYSILQSHEVTEPALSKRTACNALYLPCPIQEPHVAEAVSGYKAHAFLQHTQANTRSPLHTNTGSHSRNTHIPQNHSHKPTGTKWWIYCGTSVRMSLPLLIQFKRSWKRGSRGENKKGISTLNYHPVIKLCTKQTGNNILGDKECVSCEKTAFTL